MSSLRRRAPAQALTFVTALAVALFLSAYQPGESQHGPASHAASESIGNVHHFLEQCPTQDPLYAQFRNDFELRREGVIVGQLSCTGPVSSISIAQWTDELIVVQAVRAIYYMEGGRSVPYPWTQGSTMYEWMKSRIGGIDISAAGSHCCKTYDGKKHIVVSVQANLNREDDREWRGISERIALIGHETRHTQNHPHVGGCPLFPIGTFGCDQTYDESNISAYGIQWWLNANWLLGGINVGFGCEPNDTAYIAGVHLRRANDDYRLRFVTNPPPVISLPPQPGGPCLEGTTPPPTSPATATPPTTPTAAPTATPTQSPSPTPLPTTPATASPVPTPTPKPLIHGDIDCDGSVNAVDAIKSLRHSAQLDVVQTEPCPDLGELIPPAWGDVDCDGAVASIDALKTLRFAAGLSVSQNEPCPDIATPLT